jgi:hypothetical protein
VAHQGGGGELAGVGRNGAPVADGEGGKHGEGEGSSGNLTEASTAAGKRRPRRAAARKWRRHSVAARGTAAARQGAAAARGGTGRAREPRGGSIYRVRRPESVARTPRQGGGAEEAARPR